MNRTTTPVVFFDIGDTLGTPRISPLTKALAQDLEKIGNGHFRVKSVIKPPKRNIRFVLFNAEEHGLLGSQAYARKQAAIAAPIVSVFQMDMIGYNLKEPRSFEVHVGYAASANVQERSRVLAERIEHLVPVVSPNLETPQIYTQPDPAEGRSDHASFHQRGYAACVISEDFFAGPFSTSPNAELNPHYHQDRDTVVDFDYAADIARIVGAAA